MPVEFNGFPKESINFFAKLEKNNNKKWFDNNKADYENYLMTPARNFVFEMGERLAEISPEINADPRVNKSIFRINRDIRFSKDKRPYKINLSFRFWEGDDHKTSSGFYFRFGVHSIGLGAGIHTFYKPMLEEYRESVIHPKYGSEFVQAIAAIPKNNSYKIGGEHYKKTPRGYDPEHKNAELLLYNGFFVGTSSEIPEAFHSRSILDYCFEKFQDMLPVHKWLVAMTKRGMQ